MEQYTCERCKKTYDTCESNKVEAAEEYANNFPELSAEEKEDKAIICDDCYKEFMFWYQNGEENVSM